MRTMLILIPVVMLACVQAGWSQGLQVTVYVGKPSYVIGDDIYLHGDVKVGGVAVANATVALEVRDPAASPIAARVLTTNASGRYDLGFKLPSGAQEGTYTVSVSCNYNGEAAAGAASFNVGAGFVFVVAVTVGRSSYKFEEPIALYGNATLVGVPVVGVLVAVEVEEASGTPVLVRVLETDINGLFTLTFQMPTGSSTGIYSVHVTTTYQGQTAVANTTFELKQVTNADLNEDGKVNILDIALVANAWGTHPGEPRWNPKCDLDGNGIVNIIDITLVAREYRP